MPDESTILRYLKVQALAERGSPGEQANAQTILKSMEEKHPGIRDAAYAYVRAQNSEPEAPHDPHPSGVWAKNPPPFNFGGRAGNWEKIFNAAWSVGGALYDAAERAANASYGTQLGQHVTGYIKQSRRGNILLGLSMPLPVFHRAGQLNELQKSAFRRTLHAKLDEQLDLLFGEAEEEP